MDLSFSPEQEAFRLSVREFLRQELPPVLKHKVRVGARLTKADHEQWHAILNARGWLAGRWPKAWGGQDWSVIEQAIFDHEIGLADAPVILAFGPQMLGPVLLKFGSDEQRAHWLPRVLDGSDWWCQGYSEPNAGSDLASLRTTAVRDGDHYIVNGQKTWTTLGQHANMIFCLVRTDRAAKKQEGISFLLIDMASPGVEVRPLILLDGEHEVNEIFLTDVRVPVVNLVGAENQGWTIAKYLLTHERANIAGMGAAIAAFQRLREVAGQVRKGGRPLARDPLFAARMARVEIELANMDTTSLRVLAAAADGGAPGPEGSMLKIRGTEIRQEISSLTRRALGPYALPYALETLEDGYNGEPIGPQGVAAVAATYFNNRKLSIYGGSNEVQRNIISKMILGL